MPTNKPFTLAAAPNPTAVEKLRSRSIVASPLTSAQWLDEIEPGLRARAFWSATIESVRFLQIGRNKLLDRLSLQKESVGDGKTAYVDRSSFIGDMRKIAIQEGLGPTADLATTPTPGSLKDISSAKRLGLIYDMQIQSAQGYARWKMDQDPDVLDAFPAQELIRLEERQQKRDWQSRWIAAGGKSGRMVALKNDPIWENISAFGSPWPPYDYGSGMGLRSIDRTEAEDLGLIEPGQTLEPSDKRFNDGLEASVSDLDPDYQQYLKSVFGDQIQISDGRAKWMGKR